jgi:hypothetical protein
VAIGMPLEMATCKTREDGERKGMFVYWEKFKTVMQML